jgi:hypothetical protein
MSRTIHKYPLDTSTSQSILSVGPDAIPLHVGLDARNVACLWCEVDYEDHPDPFKLIVSIVGTGQRMDRATSNSDYLGSFTVGLLVWHVYTRWGKQDELPHVTQSNLAS